MHLIFGLGNPGERYEHTRHNFGFLAVEFLRKCWDFPSFSYHHDFSASLSTGRRSSEQIILVKPDTYMNESGKAVLSLVRFYKLTPHDMTVIHDELDLPLGEIRVSLSSGAAGHHGIQHIIESLGTKDFRRIRLGIGRPDSHELEASAYVLQPFPQPETLPAVLTRVAELFDTQILGAHVQADSTR